MAAFRHVEEPVVWRPGMNPWLREVVVELSEEEPEEPEEEQEQDDEGGGSMTTLLVSNGGSMTSLVSNDSQAGKSSALSSRPAVAAAEVPSQASASNAAFLPPADADDPCEVDWDAEGPQFLYSLSSFASSFLCCHVM